MKLTPRFSRYFFAFEKRTYPSLFSNITCDIADDLVFDHRHKQQLMYTQIQNMGLNKEKSVKQLIIKISKVFLTV